MEKTENTLKNHKNIKWENLTYIQPYYQVCDSKTCKCKYFRRQLQLWPTWKKREGEEKRRVRGRVRVRGRGIGRGRRKKEQ